MSMNGSFLKREEKGVGAWGGGAWGIKFSYHQDLLVPAANEFSINRNIAGVVFVL